MVSGNVNVLEHGRHKVWMLEHDKQEGWMLMLIQNIGYHILFAFNSILS